MLIRGSFRDFWSTQLRTWISNKNWYLKGRCFTTVVDGKTIRSQENKEAWYKINTEVHEAEIKKLNENVAGLMEKYKRSLAETENVRMRLQKEIVDSKQFGIQSFCKDLLTVADVLQMALDSIPKDQINKDETKDLWKSFYEGVNMTDKEMHKVFERYGLVAMHPNKGDKFDPNLHEALFQSPIDRLEPGLVGHVQRIGYKLNGRILRAAQVGVSAKPV